jgi:hypothetical protein
MFASDTFHSRLTASSSSAINTMSSPRASTIQEPVAGLCGPDGNAFLVAASTDASGATTATTSPVPSTLSVNKSGRRASFREIAPRPSISTNQGQQQRSFVPFPSGAMSLGAGNALTGSAELMANSLSDLANCVSVAASSAPTPSLSSIPASAVASPWSSSLLDLALLSMNSPAASQSNTAYNTAFNSIAGTPTFSSLTSTDNDPLSLVSTVDNSPMPSQLLLDMMLQQQQQQPVPMNGSSFLPTGEEQQQVLYRAMFDGMNTGQQQQQQQQQQQHSQQTASPMKDNQLMDDFLDATAFSDYLPTSSGQQDNVQAEGAAHSGNNNKADIPALNVISSGNGASAFALSSPLTASMMSPLTPMSPAAGGGVRRFPLQRSPTMPNRTMLTVEDLFSIFRATSMYGSLTRSKRDTAILCLLLDPHLSCGTIAKLTLNSIPSIVATVRAHADQPHSSSVLMASSADHFVVPSMTLGSSNGSTKSNGQLKQQQLFGGLVSTSENKTHVRIHPFTAWALICWVRELVVMFGWSLDDDRNSPLFVNANPVTTASNLDGCYPDSPLATSFSMDSGSPMSASSSSSPRQSMMGPQLKHQLKKLPLKRDAICKILTSVKLRTDLHFDRRCVSTCDFRQIDGHYVAWIAHFEQIQLQTFVTKRKY